MLRTDRHECETVPNADKFLEYLRANQRKSPRNPDGFPLRFLPSAIILRSVGAEDRGSNETCPAFGAAEDPVVDCALDGEDSSFGLTADCTDNQCVCQTADGLQKYRRAICSKITNSKLDR